MTGTTTTDHNNDGGATSLAYEKGDDPPMTKTDASTPINACIRILTLSYKVCIAIGQPRKNSKSITTHKLINHTFIYPTCLGNPSTSKFILGLHRKTYTNPRVQQDYWSIPLYKGDCRRGREHKPFLISNHTN